MGHGAIGRSASALADRRRRNAGRLRNDFGIRELLKLNDLNQTCIHSNLYLGGLRHYGSIMHDYVAPEKKYVIDVVGG